MPVSDLFYGSVNAPKVYDSQSRLGFHRASAQGLRVTSIGQYVRCLFSKACEDYIVAMPWTKSVGRGSSRKYVKQTVVHYFLQQQQKSEERIKTYLTMALQLPDDDSMPSGFAALTTRTRKLPNFTAMNNAQVLVEINNTLRGRL